MLIALMLGVIVSCRYGPPLAEEWHRRPDHPGHHPADGPIDQAGRRYRRGPQFGWVNKIGVRAVSVLTRDGKEQLTPNENLTTQEVKLVVHRPQRTRPHPG